MIYSLEDFQKVDKKKVEISTRVLKPYIIYMDKHYGRVTLIEFVKNTDFSLEYLQNQNNWISFQYYNMFLEQVVAYTQNERVLFDAGPYLLSKEAYGSIYSLLSVFKIFGTPRAAFKKIFEIASSYTNIGEFKIIWAKKTRMRLKYILFPGYKQSRVNCDAIKGQLMAIPQFWNLPPAKVKDIQCAVQGTGNECEYEVSWAPKPSRKILFTSIMVLLFLVESILFFLKKLPWMGWKELIISGLVCLGIILMKRVSDFKKLFKENKKLHEDRNRDLAEALENSKKEYKQIKEANIRIFEVVNKLTILNFIAEEIFQIKDEVELIKRILNIIVGCINFDRGYFITMDEGLNREKGNLVLDIRKSREVSEGAQVRLVENMAHILEALKDQKPRLTQVSLLDEEPTISILVAFTLRHNNYIMGFDNYATGKIIKQNKLYFFSTIISQIKLALDNIFTSKAAHNILLSIPSSILIFNQKNLEVSYVNKAYLSYYDKIKEDVIGKNIFELLKMTELNREIFFEKVQDVVQNMYIDSQEMQLDNQILGYTLFRMPEDYKGLVEIGMVMKDITKQKELQDKLLRSEKLAALGTLASGVAHEINNPLYGVLGTAEVIVDEATSDEVKKMAEDIIEFTMQVSDIVKDLSAYSRSIREEQPGDIDVNEIVDEALRIIRYSPAFIDVEIEKEFAPLPLMYALKGEISQIFMNLINNAVQAMEGRGKLRLTSAWDGKFIRISIEDSGPGIPPEYLTKIFDPFFTTKPTGEGTGLGLNIVYRLVLKYNGYIQARNSKDSGAVFVIEFPVQESE